MTTPGDLIPPEFRNGISFDQSVQIPDSPLALRLASIRENLGGLAVISELQRTSATSLGTVATEYGLGALPLPRSELVDGSTHDTSAPNRPFDVVYDIGEVDAAAITDSMGSALELGAAPDAAADGGIGASEAGGGLDAGE